MTKLFLHFIFVLKKCVVTNTKITINIFHNKIYLQIKWPKYAKFNDHLQQWICSSSLTKLRLNQKKKNKNYLMNIRKLNFAFFLRLWIIFCFLRQTNYDVLPRRTKMKKLKSYKNIYFMTMKTGEDKYLFSCLWGTDHVWLFFILMVNLEHFSKILHLFFRS